MYQELSKIYDSLLLWLPSVYHMLQILQAPPCLEVGFLFVTEFFSMSNSLLTLGFPLMLCFRKRARLPCFCPSTCRALQLLAMYVSQPVWGAGVSSVHTIKLQSYNRRWDSGPKCCGLLSAPAPLPGAVLSLVAPWDDSGPCSTSGVEFLFSLFSSLRFRGLSLLPQV